MLCQGDPLSAGINYSSAAYVIKGEKRPTLPSYLQKKSGIGNLSSALSGSIYRKQFILHWSLMAYCKISYSMAYPLQQHKLETCNFGKWC